MWLNWICSYLAKIFRCRHNSIWEALMQIIEEERRRHFYALRYNFISLLMQSRIWHCSTCREFLIPDVWGFFFQYVRSKKSWCSYKNALYNFDNLSYKWLQSTHFRNLWPSLICNSRRWTADKITYTIKSQKKMTYCS